MRSPCTRIAPSRRRPTSRIAGPRRGTSPWRVRTSEQPVMSNPDTLIIKRVTRDHGISKFFTEVWAPVYGPGLGGGGGSGILLRAIGILMPDLSAKEMASG